MWEGGSTGLCVCGSTSHITSTASIIHTLGKPVIDL